MIYGLLIDLKQSRIFYMNLKLLRSILQKNRVSSKVDGPKGVRVDGTISEAGAKADGLFNSGRS